jgi:hypothetical protein
MELIRHHKGNVVRGQEAQLDGFADGRGSVYGNDVGHCSRGLYSVAQDIGWVECHRLIS